MADDKAKDQVATRHTTEMLENTLALEVEANILSTSIFRSEMPFSVVFPLGSSAGF